MSVQSFMAVHMITAGNESVVAILVNLKPQSTLKSQNYINVLCFYCFRISVSFAGHLPPSVFTPDAQADNPEAATHFMKI